MSYRLISFFIINKALLANLFTGVYIYTGVIIRVISKASLVQVLLTIIIVYKIDI
jgi:hypothetical protein